ncbi:NAD(P)/FAD-dependent oxidoreductase [Botrimarina hoheduenensis]|uniref:3-(3-hydroxyphenyl)propionate hydroxylase n=1 Tax=Botrimarina hoheduenensis TaxID=2528000 RepID=A0A5C5VXH9_9BACT|nr:NAD(P)/FAD-dependent oxidoreductase [Botrimarina hoheduenensis]TWT43140.1 3-(3-hydroxyphenyl)propionate hydroxylase [Botrimarina hoheduenensis]
MNSKPASQSDASDRWCACIVGAGPAGALLAQRLAQSGHRVLLVDKAAFPRPKVCGGCLGGIALGALREAGVEKGYAAQPLTTVSLRGPRAEVKLGLANRQAICRAEFDTALAQSAARTGAEVRTGVRARLNPVQGAFRQVTLEDAHGLATTVRARLVVIAAGLGTSALLPPAERPTIKRRLDSRLGVGATLHDHADSYPPGELTMVSSDEGHGYAGVVRLPDGRLDIAAALSTAAAAELGIVEAVARILRRARAPLPEGLATATWRTAPRLTQRPERLGAERALLLGDAAGYVEPFTGEGIGWALRSAIELAPLAEEAIETWQPDIVERWQRRHRRAVGRQQQRCRMVCNLMGGRSVTPWVLRAITAAPWLAAPVVRSIDPTPATPSVPYVLHR